MHISSASNEQRIEVILKAISDIQFGALVVSSTTGLEASHLPMFARQEPGGGIILESHVSRANSLWKVDRNSTSLAIFQGPQAYIHPGWYPSKKRDGRAVPTWNYIAVHAHGNLAIIEDPAWLRRHLEELTARNENDRLQPWSISDAPAEYIEALIRGIVGLRLEVARLEGNWKMAQRQPLENRMGAAAGLSASSLASEREVGALLQKMTAHEVDEQKFRP